jgi:hypothetical protein
MKIYASKKKNAEIDDLDKWFKLSPPQKKEKHWKDGRSAKEMAKFWLNQSSRNEFKDFVKKTIPDFDYDFIIPEYRSKFDDYPNPRKHDLYIEGKNNTAIITIEGKADEPFGSHEFGTTFIETITEKMKNPTSKALDRMINLYQSYFYSNGDILPIMYQLVYWYASSLGDAIKADIGKFAMVLQEFRSAETAPEKIHKNHSDFEKFIALISEGRYKNIEDRQLLGLITNKFTKCGKSLYVGYYSIDLIDSNSIINA